MLRPAANCCMPSLQTTVFSIYHSSKKRSPTAWDPDPGYFIQATKMDRWQAACATNEAEYMKGRTSQEEYQRVYMVKERSKGMSNERARDLCGGQIVGE